MRYLKRRVCDNNRVGWRTYKKATRAKSRLHSIPEKCLDLITKSQNEIQGGSPRFLGQIHRLNGSDETKILQGDSGGIPGNFFPRANRVR
jgi:hypothetical protein